MPYRRTYRKRSAAPRRTGRRILQAAAVAGALGRAGIAGVKRAREGYQYATRDRPNIRKKSGKLPNNQGYNQTQWHRPIYGGRKTTFRKLVNRHVKNDMQRHVQYWQDVETTMNSRGAIPMHVRDTPGTGVEYFNCRIWDLTYMAGNGLTGNMGYLVANVLDGIQFQTSDSQGAGGSSQTVPSIVESNLNRQDWNGKIVLNAVRIKAVLYGAKSKSTKFSLQLVKFTDSDIVPSEASITARRTMWWQQYIRPYVTNPAMQHHFPAFRNKHRVLKSWNVEVQPERSNEGHDAPHHHVLDIYERFNVLCDYNRDAEEFTDQLTGITYPAEDGARSNLRDRVKPRNRIYLIVRAYNDDFTEEGSFDNETDPSMDISIKQYFIV